MKIKGIPAWEQHIEFIVLGVAVLLFVGFAAMQFLSNRYVVEVNGEELSAGEIDQRLIERASEVAAKIDQPGPEIPLPDPIQPQFEQQLVAGISPEPTLLIPGPNVGIQGDLASLPEVGVAFVEPTVSAPVPLASGQYFDALADGVVESTPGLEAFVPEEPHDVNWVTFAGSIDVGGILASFRSDSEEIASVPAPWIGGGRIYVVNYIIEREEQVDGGWTNRVEIQPIPGQETLRELLESPPSAGLRDGLMQALSDSAVQRLIIQPPFYETVNSTWMPPHEVMQVDDEEVVELTDEERQIMRLRRELASTQQRVQQVQTQMESAGCPEVAPPTMPDDPSGDEGGGGGAAPPGSGGGGFGAGGGPTRDRQGDTKRQQEQCERLRERLQQLQLQAMRYQEQLEQLTGEVIEEEEEVVDLLEQSEWVFWGHDLSVEPGTTYRYRAQIEILNPFYGRSLHLSEEQSHLAQDLLLVSEMSEWSEPISVDQPIRMFAVHAEAPVEGVSGRSRDEVGESSMEVFRFYDGRWWLQSFRVMAGEPVGQLMSVRIGEGRSAPQREIDFSTDWYVLDIVPDLEAEGRDGNGIVVLQNAKSGEIIWRRPGTDRNAFERNELRRQISLADMGEQESPPALP